MFPTNQVYKGEGDQEISDFTVYILYG